MTSQSKGRRFERQVRDFFRGLLGSQRVRLHGSWEAFDLTVGGITVECKVRAKQSGLGTIYQWLDQAPSGLLVAKLDRKRAIAITYLGDLLRVSKALAGGQTTDEAKLIVDAIDAWENQ